jgi:hypothetical protein
MHTRHLARVALVATVALPAPALSQNQTVDNLAAFAKLYGVARWFYPSDAAASINWDQFAVDGARRVREAQSAAQLEQTLKDLFTPLGPGIEIAASLPPKPREGGRDAALIGWAYRGAGMTELNTPSYGAKRTNRSEKGGTAGSPLALVSQRIPAESLRGRKVRVRFNARITGTSPQGYAGFLVRVDRASGGVGFGDNMQNRPVRDTVWREYVIVGDVASDAFQIVIGPMNTGANTYDVDAITMEVTDTLGVWRPLAVPDAGFEAMPGATPRVWAEGGPYVFSRPTNGAKEGGQFLRIAQPSAAAMAAAAKPDDDIETPVTGAAIDIDLARGLKARLRLSLTDAEARATHPDLARLTETLATAGTRTDRDHVDFRVADVVVAWNVFRHFSPYFSDIELDWDARLRTQIEGALDAAATREAHLDALRAVVADLQDGHGTVRDLTAPSPLGWLPTLFRILDNKLVVTASSNTAVPVGSIVTAMNGSSVVGRIAKETQLASGTPHWKRTRAEMALRNCPPGTAVALTIEPPSGAQRNAQLPCLVAPGTTEVRPDSLKELQPGIWYVDLTRVHTQQLREALPRIASARGVIFDLRGYPTDAGRFILSYLMSAPEDSTDRWMHVPRITGPFGEIAAWQGNTWSLKPATPHISGQRIFMTDNRAISYAESVMGYVRDYKLGTIIGGTTAGANGNVAPFSVPGRFSITFTGMRVTQHDGRTPYHTVGVAPSIPIEPTLAGIRAGRDEVLERALSAFRIAQ